MKSEVANSTYDKLESLDTFSLYAWALMWRYTSKYPVTADFIVSKIIQHNFAVRSQLVAREISKLFFVCFLFFGALFLWKTCKFASLPVCDAA